MMHRALLSLQQIAIAASLAFAFASQSAKADLITLTLNSSQSNLTLGGNAFGLDYAAQGAGSLTTSLSGTITADFTGGVFNFSGGSVITVNANPNGPFSAAPYQDSIVGAQNFGVTAVGVSPVAPQLGTVTVNGVYAGLVLDITTGTAQNGAAPTGNLNFTTGTLFYGAANAFAPITADTSSLVNVSGSNTSSSLASWDGTTLILPVVFTTTGSNRNEFWTGTITATAVPEPTSLGLVALVGIGFAAARRRMGATTQAC